MTIKHLLEDRMRLTRLASFFVLVFPAAAVAQNDTTAAPTVSTAPAFHAGHWAARFELDGSSYGPTYVGVGALRFTSPRTAWTASATLISNYHSTTSFGGSADQDLELLQTSVGRRWYRPGHARVRPFGEVGLSGLFTRGRVKFSPNSNTSRGFGGGVYGSLGAAVFLAPELSLGASWTGGVDVFQRRDYVDGTLVGKRTSFDLGAGRVHLEGAFYF